jgi:hypothetical protein
MQTNQAGTLCLTVEPNFSGWSEVIERIRRGPNNKLPSEKGIKPKNRCPVKPD